MCLILYSYVAELVVGARLLCFVVVSHLAQNLTKIKETSMRINVAVPTFIMLWFPVLLMLRFPILLKMQRKLKKSDENLTSIDVAVPYLARVAVPYCAQSRMGIKANR